MHELSLCESVLQLIEQQAQSAQFQQVKTVCLEIGQLSGVDAEAMRFCFDSVMRGSVADQAVLEIIDVAGQGWCPHCAQTVALQLRYDACPNCGQFPVQIKDGEQMRIKHLEVV